MDLRKFGMRPEIAHREVWSENMLNLACLMRIVSCDYKLDHDSNEIWKPKIQE